MENIKPFPACALRRPILAPEAPEYQPELEALAWHRQNVFRGV